MKLVPGHYISLGRPFPGANRDWLAIPLHAVTSIMSIVYAYMTKHDKIIQSVQSEGGN